MTTRHSVALLLSAGLAVGALAGCGSSSSTPSSSSTSSSTTGGADATVIAADKQAYAKYLNPNPPVTIASLGKKAPTGKTMDIVTCPVPICSVYTDGAEQAAKALGWTYKVLVSQFSPTSFQATWNTIDQDKPNVVFMADITPLSVVAKQIVAAKANGSVMVGYGIPQTVGSAGSTAAARAFEINVASVPDQEQQGRVEALQVIHDAQGTPNVLILADPSQPSLIAEVAVEKKILQAAGAQVAVVDINSANIGTTIPGTVVTYLQAHPGVQYITVPYDDYWPGIPQALRTAGLAGKVKLIGSAADDSSQQQVVDGQLFASAVHPTQANAWWMVDAAVRALVGDSIPNQNPPGPIAILTKATSSGIGSATAWPSSVYAKFRTAWGVS